MNSTTPIEPNQQYPLLQDRVQAMFIDMVIIIILMIVFTNMLEKMQEPPNWLRPALFCGIWLIYEPLLSSLAATPGQYLKGLRVRRNADHARRIGILPAVLRYIIKFFLGWISFLTINTNPEKRAIHDFATGSVVIIKP